MEKQEKTLRCVLWAYEKAEVVCENLIKDWYKIIQIEKICTLKSSGNFEHLRKITVLKDIEK